MLNLSFNQIAKQEDGYTEYIIYCNNTEVGLLQTIEDNSRDYIFCRQLHINTEHQRQGIGKEVVDTVVNKSNKRFRFCIATNSNKAINFWSKYIKNTEFNKRNIRGETWEIWK